MHPFREKTPSRRPNRAECKNYTAYRKTLREDFNKKCGYCDDSDKLRIRSYTIDHFVPQNPKDFEHNIKSNYYYNLVYSCRYCNSSKTNKWPTKDAALHNDGKLGFIDPTENGYTDLFKRSINGQITPIDDKNELAHYIVKELKLWLPIHERMWKLEKIKKLNVQIRNRLVKVQNEEIRNQLQHMHYQVLLLLEEIQNSIFVENE